MAVHRSRFELERTLGRYGASDFALVEADANAAIEFAMRGRYVQLPLPLPDPNEDRFTHTPTGRPRSVVAQERAYEQALREHWRALLLAVRGKLQSVETGISTFDNEFAGFFVAHAREERDASKKRKKSKAVNWLLGSSHSLAIALVAAFLVPASAVGAFALPPSVVDHLSAPFRGALPQEAGSDGGNSRSVTVALGSNSWTPGENDPGFTARRRDPETAFAPEGKDLEASGQPAETDLEPVSEQRLPAPSDSSSAPAGGEEPGPRAGDPPPAEKPADGNAGNPAGGANPPSAPQSGGDESGSGGATSSLPDEDAAAAVEETSAAADEGAGGGPESPSAATDPPGNGHDKEKEKDKGNGSGNGNAGGNGNGNGNANPPSDVNATPPDNGNANPPANGNGNAPDPVKPGKGKAKAGP